MLYDLKLHMIEVLMKDIDTWSQDRLHTFALLMARLSMDVSDIKMVAEAYDHLRASKNLNIPSSNELLRMINEAKLRQEFAIEENYKKAA